MIRFDFEYHYSDHFSIPHKQGVYALFSDDGTCMYVGKATNVSKRVKNHLFGISSRTNPYKHLFVFVKIKLENEDSKLTELEKQTIQELRPHLNLQLVNYEVDAFEKLSLEDIHINKLVCNGFNNDDTPCTNLADRSGKCRYHEKVNYEDKPITREIESMFAKMTTKRTQYIHLNRTTLKQLENENTFLRFDLSTDNVWRYKKHIVFVSDDVKSVEVNERLIMSLN